MNLGLAEQTAGDRECAKPSARLLHELFEQQADIRRSKIAAVCGSAEISYEDLERRSNQLARFLRLHGVRRGDRVAMLLPRSLDVYVSLLAILKAGAAYVPLDAEYPAERVSYILRDCQARALLTTSGLAAKATGFAGELIPLEERRCDIEAQPAERLSREEIGAETEDLAYIIYTSGTTGKPKGVAIEHRSVCHLVQAEAEIFQVRPEDRVYQGFSIAFDASVEEMWLAFFAGATLVAGTQEMVRAGPALSGMLEVAGVTVVSCVPTLLAMMEDDVRSMRLLILGGEVCPPDLVKRWWKPGRKVVNTYGPTEATVIATYTECQPEKPVTIGRLVPGYCAYVLDEQLKPVPPGTPGELCLGGIGLARGYVGLPELTREKFISFRHNDQEPQRLYRTGDRASLRPDGEFEYLGRIDTQVKLRGFRIELGEIEAALLDCAEVKAVAVALREDVPGIQQLVAYVVPRVVETFNEERVRARLHTCLPAFMAPALFEVISEFPTLPSGKVDRKSLPVPRSKPSHHPRDTVPPRTALESQLAEVWTRLFAPSPVSVRDDFFLDLGGHSLLAARMVSELRKTIRLQALSMLDVYQHPTIEALAAEFVRREQRGEGRVGTVPDGGGMAQGREEQSPPAPVFTAGQGIPFWRHFFCGAAQLFSLVFILSFFALQWLAPYLTYTVLIDQEYDFVYSVLGAFASLIVFYPVMLFVPIIVKWLVIGRYRPGDYPLWGVHYFRFWLATTIEGAVPVGYLAGTPLLSIYCRLMGARIGRNVHLDSDSFVIYDLLEIGDGSSINVDSNLLGYTVENGLLRIGRIKIGKQCFVGARAAVCENTVMEDGAALEDLSLLPRGETIPRGETWRGSPAAKIENAPGTNSESRKDSSELTPGSSNPGLRRFGFGVLHGVGMLIFPVLVVAALFPGIVLMNKLNYIDPYYWYLLLAPLVGLSFVVLLCLEIAAVKWLLLGRVKPGGYPLRSFRYLRKWFVDQTMDLSLDILGPLYASVYLAPWYKLLGAKLGKGAEVSTASFISPDLLSIGEESFVADSVSLGAPRVRDGHMTIGNIHIGKRSFIGNSAMLPPGTVIGDQVLIGCLSSPPANPADALRENSTWLGSPPIFLPQRQRSAGFTEESTFNPPARLRVLRAMIEFVRVITPSTCFIILLSLLFSALLLLNDNFTLWQTLMFFPLLYLGCGVAAVGFTVLAKWILVGRYRPGEKPLWCTFVWRNELLNALHEHLAEPFLVGALTGTPFVCWYFRLLGAHIGRRVYMDTTDFSEFDLARIGDEATLNADCTIQTHLFEDRVMKMSTVELGPRCVVGAGSLVLYDTQMQEGSELGDLSLLMKGETLPAWTSWEGIPARRRRTPNPAARTNPPTR
jgi:non-ribosomal peptide synthetase-like protein